MPNESFRWLAKALEKLWGTAEAIGEDFTNNKAIKMEFVGSGGSWGREGGLWRAMNFVQVRGLGSKE